MISHPSCAVTVIQPAFFLGGRAKSGYRKTNRFKGDSQKLRKIIIYLLTLIFCFKQICWFSPRFYIWCFSTLLIDWLNEYITKSKNVRFFFVCLFIQISHSKIRWGSLLVKYRFLSSTAQQISLIPKLILIPALVSGSKAMNYTNGLFDCQSPTSPFLGSLRVLHLLEDLRAALDLMDPEEKQSLRSQVSETTAEGLMEWLQGRLVGFPQI